MTSYTWFKKTDILPTCGPSRLIPLPTVKKKLQNYNKTKKALVTSLLPISSVEHKKMKENDIDEEEEEKNKQTNHNNESEW